MSFAASSQSQSEAETTQSTAGATSPAISGSKNTQVQGDDVTLEKGSSITTTDDNAVADATQLAEDALNTTTDVNGAVLSAAGNILNAQSAATGTSDSQENELLSQALANDSTLAQQTQSGGATTTDSTITTVVALAAAAVVAVLIFKK